MTKNPPLQPPPTPITREIAFLVFEDAQILDITGPLATFELAGQLAPQSYRTRLISTKSGFIRTSCGMTMQTDHCDTAFACDTLIVVGGMGTENAMNDLVTLDFLRKTASQARRIASVCSGSYILAAAGFLDGRCATTHWICNLDFQQRFPKVKLECDRIFVRDGPVWTAAGISAGIDLALAMVAEDCGEDVARNVARYLVVPYRRMGGQSQFSPLFELENSSGKFQELLRWASTKLHLRLTVEDLANKAGMSPRNFARSFRLDTGITPAKAIERLRIDFARAMLEAQGGPTVEEVARQSGFGSAERMRRSFVRFFGRTPQAFRHIRRSPPNKASVA